MNIINIQLTQDVNKEKHAELNVEPIILFNKEKSSLLPLPKQNVMNEYLENYKRIKVTAESLIRFRGKAYSVDPQYINCFVEVQEENNKIKIYYKKALIEVFDKEKYNKQINYKTEHYSKALAQSIGKDIKAEDIENKAKENLKNLDIIGGIKNEV